MSHATTKTAPANRRWLRFSLRAVLIAIAVIAVLICIPINRANRQRRAVEEIKRLGGEVMYDFEQANKLEPSAPAWLRHLLGEDYFRTVSTVMLGGQNLVDDDLDCLSGPPDVTYLCIQSSKVTDAGLARLDALTSLLTLQIHIPNFTDAGLAHLRSHPKLVAFYADNTKITDAGLRELAMLRNLRSLGLANAQITDAGLDHFQQVTGLMFLNLDGTAITDVGLQKLAKLTSLQDLEINDTQITDTGLQYLAPMNNLRRVGLNSTQTTREGIKRLDEQMPQLTIQRAFPLLPSQ